MARLQQSLCVMRLLSHSQGLMGSNGLGTSKEGNQGRLVDEKMGWGGKGGFGGRGR